MAGMPGNTAWPEALPTVQDLDHSADCGDCQAADPDTTEDIECGSGRCVYVGPALVVDISYTRLTAHCPMCGAEYTFPNEHD